MQIKPLSQLKTFRNVNFSYFFPQRASEQDEPNKSYSLIDPGKVFDPVGCSLHARFDIKTYVF